MPARLIPFALTLLPVAAHAQLCPQSGCPAYATTDQIPKPATTIPPGATPSGQAGTGSTYIPANAAPQSGIRAALTTTAADGSFSVTWAVPMAASTPIPIVEPINPSGAQRVACDATAVSATGVSGKCVMLGAPVSLTVLGTTYTLVSASTPAANIQIGVAAREPTQ